MQLELAVAETCDPTTCRVRALNGTRTTARYAAPVQDKVKVRPGDLVALNRGAEPPEVVWRWWHGTVERVEGERALVSRNVTQRQVGDPRRATMDAALPPELAGDVRAGDTVYFGGEEKRVLDVARGGVPAHPERLAGAFPAIVDAYQRLS